MALIVLSIDLFIASCRAATTATTVSFVAGADATSAGRFIRPNAALIAASGAGAAAAAARAAAAAVGELVVAGASRAGGLSVAADVLAAALASAAC